MPITALQRQATEIPPDVAAVLTDVPIHPELALRAPSRPAQPTAATLTKAALMFAALAAADLRESIEFERDLLGVKGVIHSVDEGGVLYLKPASMPRAVSLVRGELAQGCTPRPSLRPGAVRLVPAGHALTLADLAGSGALAVEVHF